MKLKILFVASSMTCLTISVFAQQETAKKNKGIAFQSIAQAGALVGSSYGQFVIQTINGVSYQNFFAGVGVGLDFYYLRSVPVTIELREKLSNWHSSPFVYAAGGVNFPWTTDTHSDFRKGGYWDFGIGYDIPANKNLSVSISLGYSIKQLSEYKTEFSYQPVPVYPMGTSDKEIRYDYTFRRIVLKAGLSF
jgi:hypothetical protein